MTAYGDLSPAGLFTQNSPQPVDVFGEHSQGDITFEAVDSMIRALIQSVHFKCVYSGLYRGVLAAQELELRRTFSLPFGFYEFALFGKYNKFQHFFEITLILWTVDILFKTEDRKIVKSVFGLVDYFHFYLLIGHPVHHLMAEINLCRSSMMLTLRPSSTGNGLAPACPNSVRLEDGEGFS